MRSKHHCADVDVLYRPSVIVISTRDIEFDSEDKALGGQPLLVESFEGYFQVNDLFPAVTGDIF